MNSAQNSMESRPSLLSSVGTSYGIKVHLVQQGLYLSDGQKRPGVYQWERAVGDRSICCRRQSTGTNGSGTRLRVVLWPPQVLVIRLKTVVVIHRGLPALPVAKTPPRLSRVGIQAVQVTAATSTVSNKIRPFNRYRSCDQIFEKPRKNRG